MLWGTAWVAFLLTFYDGRLLRSSPPTLILCCGPATLNWLDVACFSVTPILTPFVYQTSAWSWYGASCCKREHTFSFYWYILLWLAAATLTHCGACKSHSNHNYVAYRPSIDLQFLSQSKYCCFICFFYSYSLSKFLSAPWLCAVGLPT